MEAENLPALLVLIGQRYSNTYNQVYIGYLNLRYHLYLVLNYMPMHESDIFGFGWILFIAEPVEEIYIENYLQLKLPKENILIVAGVVRE